MRLSRRPLLVAPMAALATLAAAGVAPAVAQTEAPPPSPHAIDIPPWFADTFLELREDVAEAARDGNRLMVYIGQDGCPYCRELMTTNFSQRAIVDKTRANFMAVALNLWGDREVTWLDGRRVTEKTLARELAVQFTPTLLFFETDGRLALRLNGYQAPERFEAVLDWLIAARAAPRRESLAEYLKRVEPASGRPQLAVEPYYLSTPAGTPLDLARRPGSKPLAVLFESRRCRACDTLHDDGLKRPGVRAELARLDVARLGLGDAGTLIAPDGRRVEAAAWARALGVAFTPAMVFFDERGREVFRFDGLTQPFHLEAALAYVASGAHRREPQFQRFVQQRAERLRASGQPVELWR